MFAPNFPRHIPYPSYVAVMCADTMVTAWKDAEEIAIIADQWRTQKRDETLVDAAGKKKRKWQDAMDYYMGKDSLKDDATNSRIECEFHSCITSGHYLQGETSRSGE